MRWSYGVTTVPSRHATLIQTLASLHTAGFEDPWLFVDGCTTPQDYYDMGCGVTPRTEQIGAYGNWVLGMIELYLRDPQADRYVIFQDDIECVKNLREYLTKVNYPDKAYLNLHLMRDNEALAKPGVKGFVEATYWKANYQTGRGAQALVFTNESLRILLRHPHILDRVRECSPIRRKVLIDGTVCKAMNESGYKEYVHVPSLVQHMDVPTTLEVALVQPKAATYPGSDYDAMQLLDHS